MAYKEYGKRTVSGLKEELSRRGAKCTGRKNDLVERLVAYDRNFNFQTTPIVLPTNVLPEWPSSGFKQLNLCHRQDIPTLSDEHIKGYFHFRLASDKENTSDIKGIEKGKLMLESGMISACSFQTVDTSTYFTGIVKAAMKKKVSYNYKLKINSTTGEITNSDCECPAGKGPHGTCKHIATVLLMLVKFIENGEMVVGKTCTDSLQTFHQPTRSYEGSPKKAEFLQISKKQKTHNLDDPRPQSFRNRPDYQDHVRNLLINFCSNSNKDLTMRYGYAPADVQTAAADHDYLKLPLLENWVDSSAEVTVDQATNIEKLTQNQASSVLWHKNRSWRITASRFGEICKATKRRNMDKLCQSLMTSNSFMAVATNHGKQFEKKAIHEFEKKYNLKVKCCGLFICIENPFLGATPDGVINENYIVEVKCPYKIRNEQIEPGKNVPYLEVNIHGEMTLNKTHNYYYQIQGQLHISKRRWCYLVIYTFKDLFVTLIEYDFEYCKNSLIPKLTLFYEKYHRKYIAKTL